MTGAFHALLAQPGGWKVAELRTAPLYPFGPMAICGFLLIFVGPFLLYGVDYGVRLKVLLLTPILLILATALLRNWIFQDVPPNSACVWPRNAAKDSVRKYQDTITTVSMVWGVTTVVFLLCVEFMRFGLGDQWNPFTRDIRLTNGGPFREYGIIEMAMFCSGFFAITGLLWWPMYVFFEWLSIRKCTQPEGVAPHA